MKERLGILGTLALGASVALSGCDQEAKPSKTPLTLEQSMQKGITITDKNFEQFFTKCASRDELIQASEQEGKELFPILIDNPSDIKITVTPAKTDDHSFDIIDSTKPITYISPVDGPLVRDIPENGDFTIILEQQGVGIIDSVDRGDNVKKAEIQLQVDLNGRKVIYEDIGANLKLGDPIISFLANGNALGKVEYQGSNNSVYSSDLSTYATKDGKVLYCSTNEIPLPKPLENPSSSPTSGINI